MPDDFDALITPQSSIGVLERDKKVALPLQPLFDSEYKNTNGETMVAIAGVFNEVYGLFIDGQGPTHWTWLVSITQFTPRERIFAMGSIKGREIHIGTSSGRFFVIQALPDFPGIDPASR